MYLMYIITHSVEVIKIVNHKSNTGTLTLISEKNIFEQTQGTRIPTVIHVRLITDQYSLPIDM